ncbi:hypothetical protein, partial [Streptomyces sp. NPDC000410]|uniref:hypothetical protein n=1 Tax=Streptomyces sp. NPDC000410 TaxID=3154254 RepID=UPI0033189AC0
YRFVYLLPTWCYFLWNLKIPVSRCPRSRGSFILDLPRGSGHGAGQYRRNLNVRTKKLARVIGHHRCITRGNETEFEARWKSLIRDIGSDSATYIYVAHAGLISA